MMKPKSKHLKQQNAMHCFINLHTSNLMLLLIILQLSFTIFTIINKLKRYKIQKWAKLTYDRKRFGSDRL